MEISREQFFKAASSLGYSEQENTTLWETLAAENSKDSTISNWLYYFGAIIVISAMTWFMNLGWMSFGGTGIFLISVVYAVVFVLMGARLWKKDKLKTPAGLLVTIAVCMTPLAIFGLETSLGFFSQDYNSFYYYIESHWIWMELGTIIAGLVALSFYPFPFLTAPIFFATWFLSMDLMPILIEKEALFEEKAWVSLAFGLLMLFISYVIDLKKKPEYGFWGYLFGTFTFWGSLNVLFFGEGEFTLLLYLLINISMMFLSIILKRKIFMVFGALGTFIYFGHLAYDGYGFSILFPFCLTFLGLIVIYFGVLYQKNRELIEKTVHTLFPKSLKKFLPFDYTEEL